LARNGCIEKESDIGRHSLNVGCIPSKALLTSSEKIHRSQKSFRRHGVVIDKVSLDLKAMMAHKTNVVKANAAGIEYLFRKNKGRLIKGKGRIAAAGQVVVEGRMDHKTTPPNIMIATGSESMPLPWHHRR